MYHPGWIPYYISILLNSGFFLLTLKSQALCLLDKPALTVRSTKLISAGKVVGWDNV